MELLRKYLEFEEKNNPEFDNFAIINEKGFSIIGYKKEMLDKYIFRDCVTFYDDERTISVSVGYVPDFEIDRNFLLEELNKCNCSMPSLSFFISEQGEIIVRQFFFEVENEKELIAHIVMLEEKLFKEIWKLEKVK